MPRSFQPHPDTPDSLSRADVLLRADVSFALARPPHGEPVLVMQRDGHDTRFEHLADLHGTGFVLCPFAEKQGHPVVLIRDEIVVRGWQNIERALHNAARDLHEEVSMPSFAVPSAQVLRERLFQAKPDSGYAGALSAFLAELRSGRFNKLVLSRSQNVTGSYSAARIFSEACRLYPGAMVTLCHGHCGTWIGASPEVLVKGQGDNWQTMALAGTHKCGSTEPWDEKNRHEQEIVSQYIRSTLRPFVSKIQETGPYAAPAGSVEHLRTDFTFSLRQSTDLHELAAALHPTPAVCGLPKTEALTRILTTESLDRRYYAGFLGWWGQDEAALYVNLRCLKLYAGGVRLYAGGGILPESTLEQEWQETCHKMCTMLVLLGRQDEACPADNQPA